MKTLIYAEVKDGSVIKNSLELITAAREKGEVLALTNEEAAAEKLAAYTDVVVYKNAKSTEALAAALAAEAETADVLYFPNTLQGRDLAALTAGKIGAGVVTDVIEVNGSVYTRPLFGGTVQEEVEAAEGKKVCVSIRGGVYGKPEEKAGSVTVKEDTFEENEKQIDQIVELSEEVNLEEATIVVAGGRGCGSKEGFALVEELAKELGAVVGASRPAIENEWISRAHQIGQSGKNIAPKLYIACGISGAQQHVSGISGADVIVAVNKDADAPIFEMADIGIVGKIEDILPELIAKIKARKEA